VRSPEVGRHNVLPWWRNFWFSIPWPQREINFGSVSLCYKGSWALCSYNQHVVSVGNPQREVEIEVKPRPEGHSLRISTKRKFFFVLSTLNCRCLEKREHKTVEKQFRASEEHFSDDHWSVCCAIAHSRLRCNFRRYLVYFRKPETLPWYRFKTVKCSALHWYQSLHLTSARFYVQIVLRAILFYGYFATWLQIRFRCKTSTLFTSPVNYSWVLVFRKSQRILICLCWAVRERSLLLRVLVQTRTWKRRTRCQRHFQATSRKWLSERDRILQMLWSPYE